MIRDRKSQDNEDGDDGDEKDDSQFEYFEFQTTRKMDYIGWNNLKEKDFLAFSEYYSRNPGKENLDYFERHKLKSSDPG